MSAVLDDIFGSGGVRARALGGEMKEMRCRVTNRATYVLRPVLARVPEGKLGLGGLD